MANEIDKYRNEEFKGRDRRLFDEWEKIDSYCSGNDKVSYTVRKRNTLGLPMVYDIIFYIKSIVGVEEPDEQGLQKPVFGDEHVLRINLPKNYPGADGQPEFTFMSAIWHPQIRFHGNGKGCVDLGWSDCHLSMVEYIARIVDYLTYDDYWVCNEPPYPEDRIVAEWVLTQAEPNGWLNFTQEEKINNMERENSITLRLAYQDKSALVRTNRYNTVERFIENLIKTANNDPEKLWHLPDFDDEGNPMAYFVAKIMDGQTEILKPRNGGIDMTLFDYGVKEGDELIIVQEQNTFTVNNLHETIKQTIKNKIETKYGKPFYLYKYQLFRIDNRGVYEKLNIYEIWNNENKKLSYYGIKEGDRLIIRKKSKHESIYWFEVIEKEEEKEIKISVSYKDKKYRIKTENTTETWSLLHDLKELYEIFDSNEWYYCHLYKKNLLGKTELLKTDYKTKLCLLDYGIKDGDELIVKKKKLKSFFMRFLYIVLFPIGLIVDFKSIIRSKKIRVIVSYGDKKFAIQTNRSDSVSSLKYNIKNSIESFWGKYPYWLDDNFLCKKNADDSTPKTPEIADFNYKVDAFADIEILRYRVPEIEKLTTQQKELLYYLNEAALYGRDILFDQNGKYNLCIRRALEAI